MQGRRKRLVDELKHLGIEDKWVIESLLKVPRHVFFPKDFSHKAYENIAFPIGHQQTISQPYTVAFQTHLLQCEKGQKVLEIGTGSGYQSAVLFEMGLKVYTIECVKPLYDSSKTLFQEMGYEIFSFLGDGSQGLIDFAPFDRIIITAAAPDWLPFLLKQLRVGGRLVVPMGDKSVQKMILIEKTGEDSMKTSTHGEFKFVPLTGKYGWSS